MESACPYLLLTCNVTVAGIAENSHLRKSNYFYYNCITGHFLRDNCPSYLIEDNYNRLHNGLVNQLTISTGFFLDELRARKYTKVCTGNKAGASPHFAPPTIHSKCMSNFPCFLVGTLIGA